MKRNILTDNTISLTTIVPPLSGPGSTSHGKCQPPKNRITTRRLVVIMCMYSARKNRANFMPVYSVWIAAHQFLFRLRKVERQTIALREDADHEQQGRQRLEEDVPAVRVPGTR